MSHRTVSVAPALDMDWRDDAIWSARLIADWKRAQRNQTVEQGRTTAIVLERARELGGARFR